MASSNDTSTPIVQPEQPEQPEQPQTPEQPEQPAVAPEAPAEGPALVVVQPGDTWDAIAERNETTVEALHELNADQPHFSERSVQVGTFVRVA